MAFPVSVFLQQQAVLKEDEMLHIDFYAGLWFNDKPQAMREVFSLHGLRLKKGDENRQYACAYCLTGIFSILR